MGRTGQTLPQVRDEVRGLVERITHRWQRVFCESDGYRVTVVSPAGVSNGVRLTAERGNFRATVSVESIRDPSRHARDHLAIRMFGRAEATSLVAVERSSFDAIRRFRVMGTAGALALFVSFMWFIAGAQSGAYVLAGLLAMVAGVTTLTLGNSLGAYVGERLAEQSRRRTVAQINGDSALQDDLRRWRALSRELASTKQALLGAGAAGPFRALSSEETSSDTGNHPLQLATSSFSFSSS